MGKATLVVMAAGMGSRYGKGIKQLESVGPNGEIIIDYSIYDALNAGFDKVVFVIRKELKEEFKEIIGNRVAKQVKVEYAFQELANIPKEFRIKFAERTKPWGTGQAVLCCKSLIKEPFLVINADDYYGREAYNKAFEYLTMPECTQKKISLCMIGFVLENTLSENGGVTRGICKVNEKYMLTDIVETHDIKKELQNIRGEQNGIIKLLNSESVVSMNMWGLKPEVFDLLEEGFQRFLVSMDADDLRTEYLLPTIIGEYINRSVLEVKVLQSYDKWFGVTYKKDKDIVVEKIKKLIDNGLY